MVALANSDYMLFTQTWVAGTVASHDQRHNPARDERCAMLVFSRSTERDLTQIFQQKPTRAQPVWKVSLWRNFHCVSKHTISNISKLLYPKQNAVVTRVQAGIEIHLYFYISMLNGIEVP